MPTADLDLVLPPALPLSPELMSAWNLAGAITVVVLSGLAGFVARHFGRRRWRRSLRGRLTQALWLAAKDPNAAICAAAHAWRRASPQPSPRSIARLLRWAELITYAGGKCSATEAKRAIATTLRWSQRLPRFPSMAGQRSGYSSRQ